MKMRELGFHASGSKLGFGFRLLATLSSLSNLNTTRSILKKKPKNSTASHRFPLSQQRSPRKEDERWLFIY